MEKIMEKIMEIAKTLNTDFQIKKYGRKQY